MTVGYEFLFKEQFFTGKAYKYKSVSKRFNAIIAGTLCRTILTNQFLQPYIFFLFGSNTKLKHRIWVKYIQNLCVIYFLAIFTCIDTFTTKVSKFMNCYTQNLRLSICVSSITWWHCYGVWWSLYIRALRRIVPLPSF